MKSASIWLTWPPTPCGLALDGCVSVLDGIARPRANRRTPVAWKSREDKLPPTSYFTLIAAYLQSAYKNAHISRATMMTLRPFFIEEWRNGKSAEAAAQSTCSCDGHQVVPSPVVGVRIAKGSVRPPLG